MKIPDYQLSNGLKIPQLGFGTYKATDEECIQSVKDALNEGYRLIDTAAKYENEVAVGKGIAESGVPREEILVTTKVWRDELGYENTKKAFAQSLEKLNLGYIDLYLIHWPANGRNYTNWQQTNNETWRALEELYNEGKIKAIGVSNFFPEHLETLLEFATIKPVVNQIEFHPGYWQKEVTEFCRKNDILLEAWSPLGRGRVFKNELLQQLALKYQKSVSQVCLRWIIQHGVIPIPKSSTIERIKENLDVFDFELSNEDVENIDRLPQFGFSGELPDIWPDRLPQD